MPPGEAIRQEPREERIGDTVERGDAAGARQTATRRAAVFCAVGSSKGSSVFPDTAIALLLPTSQNPCGPDDSIWKIRLDTGIKLLRRPVDWAQL